MSTIFYAMNSLIYITHDQDDGFGNDISISIPDDYVDLMGLAWLEASNEYFFLTGKDLT